MRRVLLMLLLSLLFLTACGERVVGPEASPYQLFNSSADIAVGESRLVLTLRDGTERLAGVQEMEVTIFELAEDGSAAAEVWQGPATRYTMGDVEYWVSYPELPKEGIYGVSASYTTADGTRVENRTVLQAKPEPDAPAIGEAAPRSETRTLVDAPIEELTSAGPYVERFYEMTVAEAAESGKPSLIAFITPAYCTSALCGPVLETVAEASEELGDSVNVVHVEIYREYTAEAQEIDPAVTEWGLPSEPWVFVLDEAGNVAARLDGPLSVEELLAAVRGVAGGEIGD